MIDIERELINFLEKAYELTRVALKCVQTRDYDKLTEVLNNRERAIGVIQSLSEKLELHNKNTTNSEHVIEFNNQLSLVLDRISNMDDIITSCLEHEKNNTQLEIAKTFQNKENFKGYNLNNLK